MTDTVDTKACIACAEEIKLQAQLCKHCNTRQDEKSYTKSRTSSAIPKVNKSGVSKNSTAGKPKSSAVKPKKKTPATSRGKSKQGFSMNENQMFFAGGAVLLVLILAASAINSGGSGFSGFSSNTSSTTTEAPIAEISPLKGDVGDYCEPNLCWLEVTNTASEPVLVSGDLCGVIGGNVYVGDDSVFAELNPQTTAGVYFSFLGDYEGDSLDKVWLGDCSDESSAEIVWNNPSKSFTSGSQGQQGQTSQTNAISGSGLGQTNIGSSGGNSGSSGSSSSPTSSGSSAGSPSQAPIQISPPAPSDDELLNAWLSSVRVSKVSEESTNLSYATMVTVEFTFDPFPLKQNLSLYHSLHSASDGGMVSSFLEASLIAKPKETSGFIRTQARAKEYAQLSQFIVSLRKAHYDNSMIDILAVK
jgi:hypothetical protein